MGSSTLRTRSKMRRFIVADPEQFGEREAGEHGVGGVVENAFAADLRVDPVDLLLTALIAPDERGAEHTIVAIEQREAVHLTGEPDALDVAALDAGFAGARRGWRAPRHPTNSPDAARPRAAGA